MSDSPTVPPPQAKGLNRVLSRNISELQRRREAASNSAGVQEKLAAAVTAFVGSMAFAWLHVVVVGLWSVVNLGWIPGAPRFDPTFVGLATVTSVEGIFLTTFVLISQNRDARVADRRADLDLQINLLAEHEVTRLIGLVHAIAEKHGITVQTDELAELERDVAPEAVEEGIGRAQP